MKVVRKDGSLIITEHTTTVMKDEKGNPSGFMSMAYDEKLCL